MNALENQPELSDEVKENLAQLVSAPPSTLLYGGGGSGKVLMNAEDYEGLAARLTADDHGIKGKGQALHGDEAAAYGRQMIAKAFQLEDLPKEELEQLFNNQEFLAWATDPTASKLSQGNCFPKSFLDHLASQNNTEE